LLVGDARRLALTAEQRSAAPVVGGPVLGVCLPFALGVNLGQLAPRCGQHVLTVAACGFPYRRRLRQFVGFAVQVC
jgi:hypothetical protein